MRLNINAFEFDAKGLPRVFSLRVSPSYTGEGPVTVSVLLDSCERSAVAKWAKRMGVEVVDVKPYQSRPGERWTHTYEAVREERDCRLRVWTSKDLDASAGPAAASADGTAMHWPAPGLRTTTMCDGEPLAAGSFAVLESDVTCPRCRAQFPADPAGGA